MKGISALPEGRVMVGRGSKRGGLGLQTEVVGGFMQQVEILPVLAGMACT